MNKYIPKVGEAFEWRSDEDDNWITGGKCICQTSKAIGYEESSGWITSVNILCEFRPISTKADVERDMLIEILKKTSTYRFIDEAKEIQQAGFTIPKKIKRSNVRSMVDMNSSMKGYEDEGLVTAICELLGDLVEQDDKGGAL